MQHGCLTSGAKMAVASPHTWSTSAPSSCTRHQRSNAQQPRQASATTPRSEATRAGADTHTHTPVRACLGTADRGCRPARGHGVQPRGTVPPWLLVDHHATGEDASPFTSLPWSRCTCFATLRQQQRVRDESHACVLFVMIDERTTAGPVRYPSGWCSIVASVVQPYRGGAGVQNVGVGVSGRE